MPTCKKCQEEKGIELFGKSTGFKSGYDSSCKSCISAKAREYRATKKGRESSSAALKKYSQTDAYKKAVRKYEESGKGREKRKVDAKLHKDRYPDKIKCRNLTYYNIKSGKLIRQPCEECNDEKVEAHHDDYSRPLEVRWLCVKCHNSHHKNIRREA